MAALLLVLSFIAPVNRQHSRGLDHCCGDRLGRASSVLPGPTATGDASEKGASRLRWRVAQTAIDEFAASGGHL